MNKLLLIIVTLIGLNLSAQEKVATESVKAEVTTPKVATTSANALSPSFRNPWEIGLSAGLHAVQGDVNSNIGLNLDNSTFGIHARKALSHMFSWRWQYNYGNATMRHDMPHLTAQLNNVPMIAPGQDTWFVASQMYSHHLAWDNIFTIGNTSMKKLSSKWTFDIFGGPGVLFYKTKINARDENNGNSAYNWSGATAAYNGKTPGTIVGGHLDAKDAAGAVLDNLLDDSYETLADNNRVKNSLEGYAIVGTMGLGASVNYLLSNKFSISLEERLTYVFDDYIDGERWSNFTNVRQFSQLNDIISNTTVKVGYFLGKKGEKPLYWKNSNEFMMKKLASMNPRKEINAALADDDGDGVPNILDQESESKERCPVDTKGIMLDSDKDGIIDCDDKEPYSPAGYPIDKLGVAQVPPPACCGEIEAMKKEMNQPPAPTGDCADAQFPAVNFAKDKYGINSTMVPALESIGKKMQMCPDMKVVVNGINDRNNRNGKYNEQLSYNRAMEVTNYLSEKYGLSRDRFVVRYNLEGTGNQEADRAVMFRSAQLDESGNSNPPSPHPGLKAGSR